MRISILSLCFVMSVACLNTDSLLFAQAGVSPHSTDPRLKITLFAESPQIVTPTGLTVDHAGRVWAIESNTHFPPAEYKGHSSDRVLVMQDKDGDGKADDITVFLDGLVHTMSVAVCPNGDVYLATRRAIFLCHDNDGDGKCDEQKQIVHLDTPGNYPHNGLAGFAFDSLGWMFFGFGENLGADYKIIGADGTTLKGGGEGGNMYRCRPDGTELTQWATGFWNPHASCFDAFGRLFTVDNDPDSRPPCRLLHIIRHGDYGFRFRNGRKGLHPFTSWNGEIPGTLPMVAGTGEAPSGIVSYESDGLPDEYLGNLLVTSWGDHRIDRFRLKPRGVSFQSYAEPLITGGENFRPVGIAIAPDGSLYCTDWVLRDYKLHGQGRVWRIAMKEEPQRDVIDITQITDKTPEAELVKLLESKRIEVRRTAAQVLAKSRAGQDALLEQLNNQNRRVGFEAMSALAMVPVFERLIDFFPHLSGPDLPVSFGNFSQEMLATILKGNPPQSQENRLTMDRPVLLAMSLLTGLEPSDVGSNDLLNVNRELGDPFLFSQIVGMVEHARAKNITNISEEETQELENRLIENVSKVNFPLIRLAVLLASRRRVTQRENKHRDIQKVFLKDPDPAVRRAAVQWVAEDKLTDLRPQVEAILNSATTTDLFLASIAALEMLDGKSPVDFDKTPAGQYVLPIVKDESKPAAVRGVALRLVNPTSEDLNKELFASLLKTDDPLLKLETIRTLQLAGPEMLTDFLPGIAASEEASLQLRAEAIIGLGRVASELAPDGEVHQILRKLVASENDVLRTEALRSVRGLAAGDPALLELLRNQAASVKDAKTADQLFLAIGDDKTKDLPPALSKLRTPKPENLMAWLEHLKEPGDAEAGRRVFFHANAAGCFKCHTVDGRGGKVGPDLSSIARTMDRQKLAESILEPSREIAPQFVAWSVVLDSGLVHTGLILSEEARKLQLGLADGKILEIPAETIDERAPQSTSLMPQNLSDRLTISEFRDLLSFLETLK